MSCVHGVLRRYVALFIWLILPLVLVNTGNAAHGLAIDGNLKYPPGFTRFDYVSERAVKGGELILHSTGSFDKMNPYTLKGTAPEGLERFVFESLAEPSLDEPFAQYGLLAKDITVADDAMSVTYVLDENARFSDGSEVTAEDVKFSVDILKSHRVHPFYPYYYGDIKEAVVLDRHRVRLDFKKKNRELPLIASQIPILSRAFYDTEGFDNRSLKPPVGSGPYIVKSFNQGRSITYERNPDYWAADHPVNKYRYNFDSITYKYYKDPTVSLEAFKAGEFDLMSVNIAKQWARDLDGPNLAAGDIIKRKFPHHNNAGMQGFVMNTRKTLFQDREVRRAIGLAFDFEWTNKALFYDQYERSNSFFSNSYLAATGLPSSDELQLLEPLRDKIPQEVFTDELKAPTTAGNGGIRSNLREAMRILNQRGWKISDGVLKNAEGLEFTFEIILVNQSFERVMAAFTANLKKIGIHATYRTIDPALYTDRINSFDFDMCVYVYGQSQSPGNEQRNFWQSDAAERNGSRNLAGIRDDAVDRLIDIIIYAGDRAELQAASKALDRVLWFGYYLVPNWYLNGHRLAYHNRFGMPDTMPTYYDYMAFVTTWWVR